MKTNFTPYLVAGLVLLNACTNPKDEAQKTTSVSTSKATQVDSVAGHLPSIYPSEYRFLDSISCDSSLTLLIKSADITNELKNEKIWVVNDRDGKLEIMLSHDSEVDSGVFLQTASALLQVDRNKLKLSKMSIEDGTYKEIECDKILLYRVVQDCKNDDFLKKY